MVAAPLNPARPDEYMAIVRQFTSGIADVSLDRVLASMRRFSEEVTPAFRD